MRGSVATVAVLGVAAVVISSAGASIGHHRTGAHASRVSDSSPAFAVEHQGSCSQYIVIDSRGSGERGGLSAPGAVFFPTFRAAVLRRDSSARVSVILSGYPAWGSIPTLISALAKLPQRYHKSVVEGKNWLGNQVARLLASCPDSKLVLTGYSQGAQVTGDVYQNTSSKNILGVVLFGDPKFNSADPAARGGKSGLDGALGTRPLYGTAPGKPSVGHVLSYCHDRDPVCQGVSRLRYGSRYHSYYDTGEPQAAANYLARFVSTKPTPTPTPNVSLTVCAYEETTPVTTDSLTGGPVFSCNVAHPDGTLPAPYYTYCVAHVMEGLSRTITLSILRSDGSVAPTNSGQARVERVMTDRSWWQNVWATTSQTPASYTCEARIDGEVVSTLVFRLT